MNSIMATPCLITVIAGETEFTIFNQFDGSPENRGRQLFLLLEHSQKFLELLPKLNFFDFVALKINPEFRLEVFSDIRNNKLCFPENSLTNDELSLRFYDNAANILNGVLNGSTNFLVYNNIEQVSFSYTLNFNTEEFFETNFGVNLQFSKDKELAKGDFFKRLSLTLECILNENLFKDFEMDEILTLEEISQFQNFYTEGYIHIFEN